jgi:hypothetical protein
MRRFSVVALLCAYFCFFHDIFLWKLGTQRTAQAAMQKYTELMARFNIKRLFQL